MARGRWQATSERIAVEAYLVLIHGGRPTAKYPKVRLREFLTDQDVRSVFLKLCFEFDDSDTLDEVRRGLLLVVKAQGASKVAARCGVNRVSLYRMLSPEGNPSLGYVMKLLKAVGVRPYAVDEQFIADRELPARPKDLPAIWRPVQSPIAF